MVFAVAALFLSQYMADLLLSIYPFIRGWSAVQANNWFNHSVSVQFLTIFISEILVVYAVYLWLKHFKRQLKDIGLKMIRWLDGIRALIAYPVYMILFWLLLTGATLLFPSINVNQAQHIGFSSVHGYYQLILTFIGLVIIVPIAEEILFRGFLFSSLKKGLPVILAGILTSVIFAGLHLPEGGRAGPLWVGAIDTFSLSLVLVYLRQKTGSLWSGICLHALKNGVAFVILFVRPPF